MNQTILIILIVTVLWLIFFILFMFITKRNKAKTSSFIVNNKDKAIVHLYCRKTKIDNQDISVFNPVSGENLEKIVALSSGNHFFEGIFESTEIFLGKTRNIKTEKIQFNLYLEEGHTYTVAMYSYPPKERKDYNTDSTGTDILTIPLSLYEGSDNIKAYIICYRED
ncbi:hypothetical protein HMPREF9943_00829 [Eggerthia catenaformis OT 569 = DSM 20559]|uniref:Uncharacterized protein n=1 Tax=Eggerthia catenaformis OT 569 = DSM 20559 TaxID=999415 RepID=M2P8V5_9FIRM|nr:hypothetical protein [Eggerthia catenaformis]EMD16787.1 hypothetical protein HMPREF9943_00829 [Eggerthia catenaformis OT 569 = DSM 20559]